MRRMTLRNFGIVFGLIGGLFLVGGCHTAPENRVVAWYAQVRGAAVEVLVNGRLVGSGWLADADGSVITAGHAVPDASAAMAVEWQGAQYPARLVATDNLNDIALLQADFGGRKMPCLRLAQASPVIGDRVHLYGLAMWRHDLLLTGTVASTAPTYLYRGDQHRPVRVMQVASPSPPGTSGGPWLNEAGEVIGNQSGSVSDKGIGTGIAEVSCLDSIRRLLATRATHEFASLNCGFEELWTQATGFIARFPPKTAGLVTIPLEPGGAAAAAGLTKETLVVAINGAPVRRRSDGYRKLLSCQPGDRVVLRVFWPDQSEAKDVVVTLRAAK